MPDNLEVIETEVFGRFSEMAKKYQVYIASELLD
jgi:hypothetical protein